MNTYLGAYTSSTLRKSKNEPFSNAISDEDMDDIENLRIPSHDMLLIKGFHNIYRRSRFFSLKTLREDTHKKKGNIKLTTISDAISDEDINHI